MRLLFRPQLEMLCSRRMLATISGSIAIDFDNGDVDGSGDSQAGSGFVWVDSDRNGRFDDGEPASYTDAQGRYTIETDAVGEVLVRMQPSVGLTQTYPAEHFAMQYDPVVENYRLASLDSVTGVVTPLGDAFDTNRNGLIKTIDGRYFGAGHVFDSLYEIDPVTGRQTLIGHMGQEVVGGLAYDPIMDEIYTLARPNDDSDPVAALNLYKVDRATAALIPVSEITPSIDGIRFTTSLTFDWVHREIVLFDNGSDTAYAYDLLGEVRKLGTFAPSDTFFNLAFDGSRFLTHRTEGSESVLFEVDPYAGTLTRLVTLDSRLSVNASDRLAANQAHTLNIATNDAVVEDVNFLVVKLALPTARLELSSAEGARLLAMDSALDTTSSFSDESLFRFCVSGETDLTFVTEGADARPVHIDLGDLPDSLTVEQSVFERWPNLTLDLGSGHDVLSIEAASAPDWEQIAGRLHGVDELNFVGPLATEFRITESSIAAVSDNNTLTVRHLPQHTMRLGDDDWESMGSEVADNQRLHVLATDEVILKLRNSTPWQNPLDSLDVNADGFITPIDALQIINFLNSELDRGLSEGIAAYVNATYIDTTADNVLSPFDALLVINHLNND